jgi:hypothetical protein
MCINFQCKPIIPLSEKANSYRKILLILLFINLIIILIKISLNFQNEDFFSNILEIFLFSFACIMCHYVLCLLSIFLSIFNLIFTTFYLGQILQNKILNIDDDDKFDSSLIIIIINCIYFIYCIILIIYLFLSYREFKAISREGINDPLNGFNESKNNNNLYVNNAYKNEYNIYNSNNLNNNDKKKKFIPFSGKGYTVGGN